MVKKYFIVILEINISRIIWSRLVKLRYTR